MKAWTNVNDIAVALRKRWDRGIYLRAHASGEPWIPVTIPVKAPSATELLHDFDHARRWDEQFRRDARTRSGTPRFTIETRTVKGKQLGVNEMPVRVRFDTLDQMAAFLRTTDDVRRLASILVQTDEQLPALTSWVCGHPMVAVENHDEWSHLLDVVAWISGRDTSLLYVRHIDVRGVDTKFVHHHQKILGQLLALVLPPERIDPSSTDFARRYGLRPKPDYTRLRLLTPVPAFPAEITEVRVRTEELAKLNLPVETVFIIENEVTYLAFPEVPNSIAVFGEGFHAISLRDLPWFADKQLVYWGDIDTHGFAILNHMRSNFPTVTSILMDHDTLAAHHPTQTVTEPEPTSRPLPHLTVAEQALYQDLIEDRYGRAIRLEQERIRFSRIRQTVQPWTAETART